MEKSLKDSKKNRKLKYTYIHSEQPEGLGGWRTSGDYPNDNIIEKRPGDLKRIAIFAVPAEHRVKVKESEKKDKYLDFTRELKKTVEHESDVYINYNWCSTYSHRRIIKGTGGLGNKRTCRDHPNYCMKDHELTLR